MMVYWTTGSSAENCHVALAMLARAYEPGMADETYEMLVDDLRASRCLLWVAYRGDEVFGSATTKVVIYPNNRRVCVITACAGHHWQEWSHTIKEIEQYAREAQCSAVRLSGRRGWKRVLKDYREPWVLLEKEL